jgi:hypothetical protein
MEDFKILFWVLAIGIYIFSQIREVIKKARKNAPVPAPKTAQPKPVINQSYSKPVRKPYVSPSLSENTRKKSTYGDIPFEEELLGKEIISREAFYKSTHTPSERVNYDNSSSSLSEYKSVFGVDEHLTPYTLKEKYKHPLLKFLSDQNNLRNAFVAGEVLNKKQF